MGISKNEFGAFDALFWKPFEQFGDWNRVGTQQRLKPVSIRFFGKLFAVT